jgi:hypothetical protein
MIALYILLGLIAVVLILAAVMPGKYTIEKEIVINKPPTEVFKKVADFNYYREWNPWQKSEPTAKYKISGTPSAVGHRYDWEGKKIGSGSLTVRSLNPSNTIELDLEFIKPWKSKASDNWKFEDLKNGSTKVIWHNTGPLPYPVARLMGPVIHKNLSTQFVQGLNSLKEMCEK